MSEPLRAMMIGAHPDDVDICTCGITKRLVSKGCIVRFVSMTTGNAGHQTMRGEELIKTRAAEAQKSAAYLGATYEILPFDDGRLTPSLEARETLMRTITLYTMLPSVTYNNSISSCQWPMASPSRAASKHKVRPPAKKKSSGTVYGTSSAPSPRILNFGIMLANVMVAAEEVVVKANIMAAEAPLKNRRGLIPAKIRKIDKMPLNKNGKIDRKYLAEEWS